MLRSMTGFGVGEAPVGRALVHVEVRAVNHRHLEVRVKVAPELGEHAGALEDCVRTALGRGRVEVSARFTGEGQSSPALDVVRARAVYEQLLALRDALAPREPVPLSLLAAVPELFVARSLPEPAAMRAALVRAAAEACRGVGQMRDAEGAVLGEELAQRLGRVDAHVQFVEARGPAVVEAVRARLHARIAALLEGSPAPLDPGRLELEVVLAADRMDVTEECTRLRSHVAQFRASLGAEGGEARGRRFDFLLQEMAREANTLGAKSADAETAQRVVELKADLERLREQVQNIL